MSGTPQNKAAFEAVQYQQKFGPGYLRKITANLFLLCLTVISIAGYSLPALAVDACTDTFPNGLQVHSGSGQIELGYNAQVLGVPSPRLETPNLNVNSGSSQLSCGAQSCLSSGLPVSTFHWPVFKSTTESNTFEVAYNGSAALSQVNGTEFGTILLNAESQLQFTEANLEYRIGRMELGSNAKVYLPPGDYWIRQLNIASSSEILTDSNGTVRLFVQENLSIGWSAQVNMTSSGEEADASRLLVYGFGDIVLNSNVRISGLLFAQGRIELGSQATVYGAITGSTVIANSMAKIYYRPAAVNSLDYGLICGTSDTDGDGIPDANDPDIDGDGIVNEQDAFPYDATESSDLDGDLIGDNADTDRDGDGFSNIDEIHAGTDPDNAVSVPEDINGNGTPDNLEGYVNSCTASYPNGLQSHSDNGVILLGYNSQISDTAVTELQTPTLYSNGGSTVLGCYNQACFASGNALSTFTAPDFKLSQDTNDINVPYNGSGTIGADGAYAFDTVSLNSQAILTLSPEQNEYFIKRLDVGQGGQLVLPAGDIWIDELTMGSESQLLISGSGTVRLFIGKSLNLGWRGLVNSPALGQEGSSGRLLIYSYGGISLNSESTVSALLYAAGTVDIQTQVNVFGAVVAGTINTNSYVNVHYRPTGVAQLDFGHLCDMDGDSVYDKLDTDRDGDGASNDTEQLAGTDPNDPDSSPAASLSDLVLVKNRVMSNDGVQLAGIASEGFWLGPFPTTQENAPTVTVPEGQYKVTYAYSNGATLDTASATVNVNACLPIEQRSRRSQVTITWEELQGATAYEVFRAIESAPNDFQKIAEVTNPLYADNSVANENSYLYAIGAITDNGTCFSNVVSSHPTASRSRGPINYAPVIYSQPITHGTTGYLYNYDVNGADPNNDLNVRGAVDDALTFRLVNAPGGMIIDESSGLIEWLPGQAGVYEITVELADAESQDLQSFSLEIEDLDQGPGDDMDNDGIPDDIDPDRDGDGVNNDEDAFPNDPSETKDSDGDGIGDNADADRDGDQVPNDEDAFPDDPNESSDLDNDGIGDNADPDRDGDSVSNDDEIAAGTDPNDASDYPDTVAPELTVNTIPASTDAESWTVTGTVTDPGQPYSGVALVRLTSDRYPDATFAATLNGSGFSAEIPLQVGLNAIVVTALDLSDNTQEELLEITRDAPPRFIHIAPVSGTIITEDSFTLTGEVHTSLPLPEVRFYVNEWQITPNGTADPQRYTFVLPDIPLSYGDNAFQLRVEASGYSDAETLTIIHLPDGADNLPAPAITIQSPTDGSLLSESTFVFAVRVVSEGGPLTLRLNDEPLTLPAPELTVVDYSQPVSFPEGQDSLSLTIEATDSLNKTSTTTVRYYRDNMPPEIELDNDLELGSVNTVLESPYILSGRVIDANLSSLTVNDVPVQLSPGIAEHEYEFSYAVALATGQETPLNMVARDLSGNQKSLEVVLMSNAVTNLNPILPAAGAQFLSQGDPVTVQVAVRATSLQEGDQVIARVDAGLPVQLARTGSLYTGDVVLPGQGASYQIRFEALNAVGNLIASSSLAVSVTNAGDIPLELVRIEPDLNARHVEPNASVELYFNKPIELSKLSFELKETLHGHTYIDDDPLGLDFVEAQGYELEQVNRNREQVPGRLSLLPGETTAVFYPERQLGFNAELYVEVSYDGQELTRTTFTVRELPTFIIGGVSDQFGQPLEGVEVSLPDLGRSVTTNGDGGYAFGFQEQADQVIPGGRHRLIVNPDMKTPHFGTMMQTINVQRNRRNNIEMVTLQELNREVPYQFVEGGRAVSLSGGELELDLTNASLLFPNQRSAGRVHTQFLPFEQMQVDSRPEAMPLWVFANQPRGIQVSGSLSIDITIPALRGSYDYVPDIYRYVVLLGYDPELEVLQPIGVGKIENQRVVSLGPVEVVSLDFFGYSLVDPVNTPLMEAVANGEKTLQQLLAELQ